MFSPYSLPEREHQRRTLPRLWRWVREILLGFSLLIYAIVLLSTTGLISFREFFYHDLTWWLLFIGAVLIVAETGRTIYDTLRRGTQQRATALSNQTILQFWSTGMRELLPEAIRLALLRGTLGVSLFTFFDTFNGIEHPPAIIGLVAMLALLFIFTCVLLGVLLAFGLLGAALKSNISAHVMLNVVFWLWVAMVILMHYGVFVPLAIKPGSPFFSAGFSVADNGSMSATALLYGASQDSTLLAAHLTGMLIALGFYSVLIAGLLLTATRVLAHKRRSGQ